LLVRRGLSVFGGAAGRAGRRKFYLSLWHKTEPKPDDIVMVQAECGETDMRRGDLIKVLGFDRDGLCLFAERP